jgi:hypothetical protein
MNTQITTSARADSFGRSVAMRLTEGSEDLPHDITERLRSARVQAVSKRRTVAQQVVAMAAVQGSSAAMQLGAEEGGWLGRMGALLPLLALVIGLVGIGVLQDDLRANELAEVDAEILTDELPPSAYTDPGFAQYLRTNHSNL